MPDELDDVLDDEILNDLFMPEDEGGDDSEGALDSEALKELKAELDETKRQNNGLLQTLKGERGKRQELRGTVDNMKDTINSILVAREEATSAGNTGSEQDVINVDITDDGDAFIPREKLDAIVSPMQEEIDDLNERLQLATQQQDAVRESEQLIQSIVGEDESYTPAYNKYKAARRWVNDRVIDFQRQNNYGGQVSSGDAMTHVFDESMTNEFNQQFPEMDLFDVATAEDSAVHFERMLKHTVKNLTPKQEPDNRFRQVLQKPSGLGKSANAKGGELSLTERVGNLSSMDIMDLTDAQVEALSKYIDNDEQKEGIKF